MTAKFWTVHLLLWIGVLDYFLFHFKWNSTRSDYNLKVLNPKLPFIWLMIWLVPYQFPHYIQPIKCSQHTTFCERKLLCLKAAKVNIFQTKLTGHGRWCFLSSGFRRFVRFTNHHLNILEVTLKGRWSFS